MLAVPGLKLRLTCSCWSERFSILVIDPQNIYSYHWFVSAIPSHPIDGNNKHMGILNPE